MRRPEFEAPPVDPAAIARAVEVLKRGGLVALPTETVYGLAADATNESAVRAIFAAKGRPADHPVSVHVPDERAIELWATAVPPAAQALAQAFSTWVTGMKRSLRGEARICPVSPTQTLPNHAA